MISFYLLWTGCYFVLLRWLSQKWPKNDPNGRFESHLPSVALLIPLRNEKGNLSQLIEELQKINYPNLEIILIDDQSEDDSFDFLNAKLGTNHKIKILKSSGEGKKIAIETGIKVAKSELILCSDADCVFPEDWVFHMISPFSNPAIQLVTGPVISMESATFFHRFQQLEWSSILLLTQYFFSQKQPVMCSGANLAYRKSAFETVNGYEQNRHYLSGDDEFLLKKISRHFGGKSCVYRPSVRNLVTTHAQNSFASLINQRVRWAGKWKLHQDLTHAWTAVISFLIQLIWLGGIVLLGLGNLGGVAFLLVWTGKIAAEKMALGRVLESLRINSSIFDFLKTGLLHPFYVIYVVLGSIRGKFEWKGRGN